MKIRSLLFVLMFLVGTACQTVAPTPILMGRMTKLNNEVVQLYTDCSDGANYVPTKEGCDPELLGTQVDELIKLSLNFVRADFKQSPGYDIYLATAMIFFRIGERNLNDYTRAEQIARQFFEVQKAHSGQAIDTARFYWPWFASATSSKQYFEDRLSLTAVRKSDLLLALNEGTDVLLRLEGPRLVRLRQALATLQYVINSIE